MVPEKSYRKYAINKEIVIKSNKDKNQEKC